MPDTLIVLLAGYVYGVMMMFVWAMSYNNRPAFFRNPIWGLLIILFWPYFLPLHYGEKLWRHISRFIEKEKLR